MNNPVGTTCGFDAAAAVASSHNFSWISKARRLFAVIHDKAICSPPWAIRSVAYSFNSGGTADL